MWTSDLYDNRIVKSNKLRCIMQNKDNRRAYFVSMSTAMATMCDIFATVMDKEVDQSKDKNKITMNGIWGKNEFPTLKMSDNVGKVNQVDATNPDGSIVFTFWTRGSTRLRKRQTEQLTCGISDDQIAADFDEGGDYPVDW